MISPLFCAASLAASLAVAAAGAHAQAAPATTPAIPYPGKLASAPKFTAFNKDYSAYGECMKKYIDETKLIMNAAVEAVNEAVEEFNKFAADIKAQDEAAKN
jgi:hypothetical protein